MADILSSTVTELGYQVKLTKLCGASTVADKDKVKEIYACDNVRTHTFSVITSNMNKRDKKIQKDIVNRGKDCVNNTFTAIPINVDITMVMSSSIVLTNSRIIQNTSHDFDEVKMHLKQWIECITRECKQTMVQNLFAIISDKTTHSYDFFTALCKNREMQYVELE